VHNKTHLSITIVSTLTLLALTGCYLFLLAGDIKSWANTKWLDVFAEGGMTIFALFWLVLLLRSRPAGRVTLLLALGLSCFVFSWWMDFIDEFIKIPADVFWDNWLESFPIAIGLVLLSVGIFHWHQEELAISAQMVKRERVFREHRLFDALIPIGGADYLREQVKLSLKDARLINQQLSLVAIDIDNFSHINQRFGHLEGDNVLQSITQLLLLNLREQDLLCRLAGDRFVALLPNTNAHDAEIIALELKNAIEHLAYKTSQQCQRIHLSASTAVAVGMQDEANTLIKNLNINLGLNKKHLVRAHN
jgi:diguanylate cyclase (GGDEF)-like protein